MPLSLEFAEEGAEGETDVSEGGGRRAVVVAHDVVALLERCLVVLVGQAVGEETHYGGVAHIGVVA